MIVVIPAYQPDEKLLKTVTDLQNNTGYPIVVVDDGSSEASAPVFSALEGREGVTVLHLEVNRGKGRAMKTAFEHIKSCGEFEPSDGVVTVDADGQHLIPDIMRVCDAFHRNPKALIIGGRAFTGKVPLRSRFGNAMTRFVFALTTGVRVHDTQTGLRAFSVSLIDEMLSISGERYEYEINQLLTCTKKNIRIVELEIETVYLNDNESSHFNVVRDSWRIYKSIFAFIGSSFFCWILDYVLLLVLTGLFSSITGGAGFVLFGRTVEPKLPALVIARTVSSIVNYYLNRELVFASKANGSLVRYFALVVVMLAVNYLLLNLLTGSGIPIAIAQILAQIIIYPVNYVIQRRYVFNERS
ncbi:MAG: bifunctional glycosyltransferase family 2/GtrA family protein [Clostridia bacterium]|nr:bifunctional glycosyltransferase family 2/GtrA family protein [Clostridia bacterium]